MDSSKTIIGDRDALFPNPFMSEPALVELAKIVLATGYSFTTVTPETHRRLNERPFDPRTASLRDVFGWSRPFDETAIPGQIFGVLAAAGALEKHGAYWRSLVRLSTLDGLLFMHSAYPTLSADAVFFGPDTYRFANALNRHLEAASAVTRAADIGCGTGAGGILVARAFPEAEIILGDINDTALLFSRVNAEVLRVHNSRAVTSNLLSGVKGSFDLIVSNPPYLVDRLERSYRHGGGLLGAGLSLDIVDEAISRLSPGGTLLLYTGAAVVGGIDLFRQAAQERLHAAGMHWAYREMDPDVFGEELDREPYDTTDRIAAVVLTAKKPGGI